jgi:CubicO group peptidase (beta-lactamase class C family)
MKNLCTFIFSLLPLFIFSQKTHIDSIVDNAAKQFLTNAEFNCVSVGVNYEGKTYTYYYGFLDNSKKEKPNDNTLFEIASLTKTLTGNLLAQAVLDNKINLDADIRMYLKGDYPNLEYNKQPITLRHLTLHKGGLPYTFPDKPELFINPNFDSLPFILNRHEEGFTRNDFFNCLHKVTIKQPLGETFNYSNAGTQLVAYILEAVYGLSYDQLLEKYIFKTADMTQTKLLLNASEKDHLAQGFNEKGAKMPFYTPSVWAAGGLKSTLPDMLKYVAFQLDESTPSVKMAHSEIWNDKNDYAVGFNWQIIKSPNKPVKLFQNGGAYGTTSWLELYPSVKTGFIAITNVSSPEAQGKLEKMIAQIKAQL